MHKRRTKLLLWLALPPAILILPPLLAFLWVAFGPTGLGDLQQAQAGVAVADQHPFPGPDDPGTPNPNIQGANTGPAPTSLAAQLLGIFEHEQWTEPTPFGGSFFIYNSLNHYYGDMNEELPAFDDGPTSLARTLAQMLRRQATGRIPNLDTRDSIETWRRALAAFEDSLEAAAQGSAPAVAELRACGEITVNDFTLLAIYRALAHGDADRAGELVIASAEIFPRLQSCKDPYVSFASGFYGGHGLTPAFEEYGMHLPAFIAHLIAIDGFPENAWENFEQRLNAVPAIDPAAARIARMRIYEENHHRRRIQSFVKGIPATTRELSSRSIPNNWEFFLDSKPATLTRSLGSRMFERDMKRLAAAQMLDDTVQQTAITRRMRLEAWLMNVNGLDRILKELPDLKPPKLPQATDSHWKDHVDLLLAAGKYRRIHGAWPESIDALVSAGFWQSSNVIPGLNFATRELDAATFPRPNLRDEPFNQALRNWMNTRGGWPHSPEELAAATGDPAKAAEWADNFRQWPPVTIVGASRPVEMSKVLSRTEISSEMVTTAYWSIAAIPGPAEQQRWREVLQLIDPGEPEHIQE